MIRVTNVLCTKRKGKSHNVSGQTKPEEINLQRRTRSKKRKEHKQTMKVNTHRRIELNNTYTTNIESNIGTSYG
jgi:hypothetical protein